MTTSPHWLTSGYLPAIGTLARDPGFGLGFLVVSGLGIGVALRRRTPADWALLASVALTYLVVAKPGFGLGTEWLLPALPAVLVLGARALVEFGQPSRIRSGLVGAALALTVVPAIWTDVRTGVSAADTTFLASKRWIEAHIPAGTAIALDDRRVPQLSFTPESLKRRRSWGTRPTSAALMPSRHETFEDRSLVGRRDASLTAGVAYDLYVMLDPAVVPTAPDLFSLGPEGLRRQFGVQAIVLSGWFAGDNSPARPEVRHFYDAVRRDWSCVAEFSPGPRLAGDAIWVYAAPDFAERLGLAEIPDETDAPEHRAGFSRDG